MSAPTQDAFTGLRSILTDNAKRPLPAYKYAGVTIVCGTPMTLPQHAESIEDYRLSIADFPVRLHAGYINALTELQNLKAEEGTTFIIESPVGNYIAVRMEEENVWCVAGGTDYTSLSEKFYAIALKHRGEYRMLSEHSGGRDVDPEMFLNCIKQVPAAFMLNPDINKCRALDDPMYTQNNQEAMRWSTQADALVSMLCSGLDKLSVVVEIEVETSVRRTHLYIQ